MTRKSHGWIFLDKPYGMSSNKALQKVRACYGRTKAGHVGTLDPLATGLLPIALGEATKTIPYFEKSQKVYVFEATWGQQRTTGDQEGAVMAVSDCRPTAHMIKARIGDFIGDIQQVPPVYSAIKIDGQPAYQKMRRGDVPQMNPRSVRINTLELMSSDQSKAQFRMSCESGVFVRSLVRDLAISLGTVGYVSALRRVQVGPFSEKHMLKLEKILETQGDCGLKEHLHPLDVVLDDIPVVALEDNFMRRLMQGQRLCLKECALPQSSGEVLCRGLDGRPIGFAEIIDNVLHPRRLFNL